MARKRINLLDEESLETPKNENEETSTNENPEVSSVIMDEPVTTEEVNEHIEETKKAEEVINLKIGDRVRIKEGIGNDMLGRRIHNGIRNYLYKIINIRNDGYCTITCLTHTFTLKLSQLEKIK